MDLSTTIAHYHFLPGDLSRAGNETDDALPLICRSKYQAAALEVEPRPRGLGPNSHQTIDGSRPSSIGQGGHRGMQPRKGRVREECA